MTTQLLTLQIVGRRPGMLMLIEMPVFTIVLVLFCALGLLLFFRTRTTRLSPKRTLPVVGTDTIPGNCVDCRYFSLEGGQALLQAHAPFAAAAQHIPPWQMGRPRAVEPNLEYDELEARMIKAGEDGNYEEQAKLHNELLEMNPGEVLPPGTSLDGSLLTLQWQDFGACGMHHEIRARTDRCEKWEAK